VTFGGTRATLTILDGSHSILSKLAILSTMSKKWVSRVLHPHQQSFLQYTQFVHIVIFYWVMRAPSPVMMDECLPERRDDDIDEEFDYDFINDGAVAGEYSSLFTPQQSTT
jgi:hypothetical protein